MKEFINAIKYLIDEKIRTTHYDRDVLVQRYLVIDKPVMTITNICKKMFKAKLIIKIPKLQILLLFIANLIKLLRLHKKIPLSKERVIKLYKPTDYSDVTGYKEWINEEN